MQLIFNELSLMDENKDIYQGIKALEQFIDTYSEAVKSKNGFNRSILTNTDLNTISLANNYNISKWRNSNVDRDLLRRFINICDRQNISELNQDEAELICDIGAGKGMLAAYENLASCISFSCDPFWDNFEIACRYYSLDDDKEYDVAIYNFSKPKHFIDNLDKVNELKRNQLLEIHTPTQLLEKLDSLYPSLVFHTNVLNQIKNEVQSHHIDTLCHKLAMLESYFSQWDGTIFDESAFPPRSVSPQSKETLNRFKREHTFEFPDQSIVVSYHIRYTGNIPGRIYFHPVCDVGKAYICSVTTKLPSVLTPKSAI